MPLYIGLLRAVNVAGAGQVRMEDLTKALERERLGEVRTLLASGNVLFRSPERDADQLEARLEKRVARDLGLTTTFFVRSSAEWAEIVARNPFPGEAASDPGHLVVMPLKADPPPARWKALDEANRGPERIRGDGRTAYLVYPEGIGRSRLTTALIEKCLGTRGTGRNWNTVTKLAAMVGGSAPSK